MKAAPKAPTAAPRKSRAAPRVATAAPPVETEGVLAAAALASNDPVELPVVASSKSVVIEAVGVTTTLPVTVFSEENEDVVEFEALLMSVTISLFESEALLLGVAEGAGALVMELLDVVPLTGTIMMLMGEHWSPICSS